MRLTVFRVESRIGEVFRLVGSGLRRIDFVIS